MPTDLATPLIETQSVVRTYQVGAQSIEVLKGVNLTITSGERTFLCGPSGAGKTTLLYTLAGLEAPNKGSVIVEGEDLYTLSSKEQSKLRNQKIGYIFQNFFLLPELTAIENVALSATIAGKSNPERAATLLEKVGLAHRADHLPTELSGGEQQRVAVARSLMNSPKILFADEPTGNLDTKNGATIMRLLMELSEENGTSLVVVTHDSEIAKMGDRQIWMKDGVIA